MSRTREFLRRATAPLRGPIDGRVGDINRRIGDTRKAVDEHGAAVHSSLAELRQTTADIQAEAAGLTRTVDSYAAALAEAASVTGVELRRLADLVRGITGSAPAEPERLVETAFASGALGRLEPPAQVLAIGDADPAFALSAATLGYRVTAVDSPLPCARHPGLESVATPIEAWEPGDRRFDAVFLISAAGQPRAAESLARIATLISDDGVLVLTTSCRRSSEAGPRPGLDVEELCALLSGWKLLEGRTIVDHQQRRWRGADGAPAAPPGLTMVIATPVRPG